MSLVRVRAAPKATASNSPFVTIPCPTAPAFGNGLVVPVVAYRNTTPTCRDNYGNGYSLTVLKTNGLPTVFIFYCPYVIGTGPSFAVTVDGGASNSYYVATAIEVSGVGYGLMLDQVASALGTGTAVATGATPALTGPDVFVCGVLELGATQSFITVESVAPPWTQEVEELPFTIVSGEADSRVLTAVAGATTSCSWTISSSTTWTSALAAFRAQTAPTGVRATQLAAETFVTSPAQLRATQLALEVFATQPASVRATQLALEVFVPRTIPTRATQLAVEVFQGQPARLRVTQHLVELWVTMPPCIRGDFPIDPESRPRRT